MWLFHSHAYFDHGVPERIAEARAFMDLVIRTFAGTDHLEVHGFTPFPAGPHRRGRFEVLFTREAFADSVSWLMFSRPPWLDILVHPLTGSQLLDHTRRAFWLGTPLAIDCTLLKEADAKLFAAGQSEESIIDGTKTHGRRRAERQGWGRWRASTARTAASMGPGVCFEAMNRTT